MRLGNRRFLVGVGVSVGVHLLLLLAYRHTGPSMPAFQPEAPSSIAVTIRPPAPPPAPPKVEEAARPPAEPAAPRPARRRASPRVIAVPATQESPGEPFVVEQATEPAEPAESAGPAPDGDSDAPKFDLGAARQTARQLAGQTKLGREGTAVAQFPDPPLETETKAARAIGKAKRRNCKDGLPGGLLAPLFLAMDKKDSGCKW
ncbi:hypothetical protein [Massilia consociata]|uniref:Energy transducer TonB n=1 Tax=Massilia consociata TaxID=760117 RepID=A0ABV6FFK3_9BURK